MADAFIIDAVRTPRGVDKQGKGSPTRVHPGHLERRVLEALRDRNGFDRDGVHDITGGSMASAIVASASEPPAVSAPVDVLDPAAPWCRAVDDGWSLTIRVQPGARRSEVVGSHGDALRIRAASPPVDGTANAELLRFLAAHLGLPASAVEITKGHASRTKVVHVRA
ncbi:MAG: DUF167 family protein [Acidimicrobiia bacterium]